MCSISGNKIWSRVCINSHSRPLITRWALCKEAHQVSRS